MRLKLGRARRPQLVRALTDAISVATPRACAARLEGGAVARAVARLLAVSVSAAPRHDPLKALRRGCHRLPRNRVHTSPDMYSTRRQRRCSRPCCHTQLRARPSCCVSCDRSAVTDSAAGPDGQAAGASRRVRALSCGSSMSSVWARRRSWRRHRRCGLATWTARRRARPLYPAPIE